MTRAAPFAHHRRERGAAALELALVLMPMVLIVAALASLGMLFLAKQSLARAASEGARAIASASRLGPVHPAQACQVVDAVMARTNAWVGATAACGVWPAPDGAACGTSVLTCMHVRVCYPPTGTGIYPVLGMLAQVMGANAADRPMSSHLWAQATVQFAPSTGSNLNPDLRCA